MLDHFAVLNEPRRPWIDLDLLKSKFLALSAEAHPDRVHQAADSEKRRATLRYTELNAAYNCLRDPKERLAHLLELELGQRPANVQTIPPNLADEFAAVAQLCRQADGFLGEKRQTTAALLQVSLLERAQAWTEKLGALQAGLGAKQESLMQELKNLNTAWAEAESARRAESLARLEEIYRLLSYFARWSRQIQERIVQLSF